MPFIDIGSVKVPTFFLVISASLTVLLFFLSARTDQFKKNRKIAFDLALLLMFSGFAGGRLMHVFYEEWPYYLSDPVQILFFWRGGFVFLGGLIACLIAGFIFTKVRKIGFREWADFFTPLFSLAHALGRIGCYLSGCCFGRACELPWASEGRHPTALYLLFGELAIFALLLLMEKGKVYRYQGSLFMKWLLLHSLLRFSVEYYRDDFRGLFIHLPVFGAISVSQLISLIIMVVASVFLSKEYRKKTT